MGSTSQLVTAPCIQTLIGSDVDIIFWEFAMNDEMPQISYEGSGLRYHLAETWIKEASRSSPKAIFFLHYYDLDIHGWDLNQRHLPDKAWVPTNYAADIWLKGTATDGISINMLGVFLVASQAFQARHSSRMHIIQTKLHTTSRLM
jgi:hypothetical protein